ncbi:hypothetical protein [Streptomyces sp. NPDC059970]|uniref:hypothetical protein n=1 Tax=Streptomyces sp. NPDC059970 TaxID=3347019 RepID=UPI0036BD873D
MLAITWAVLELIGERHVPVVAPMMVVLTRWFYNRHRHWGAGLVAAVSGSPVVFVLDDRLRPPMERLLADATATAVGLVVAMVVFTVCSPMRRRA